MEAKRLICTITTFTEPGLTTQCDTGGMREYVLQLEYELGVHPVMDVFIQHPDMIAKSLDISVSLDGGWRIVRVTGPEEALAALEDVYLNPDICNDCVFPHPACDGEFEYQVLESEPTARTIYKYVSDVSYCHSVTFLALSHFGTGLIFDAEQRGSTYRYRILVPSGVTVRGFRDVLDEGLPDGVSVTVERIGEPHHWIHPRYSITDLPFEQRQALETAFHMGYYETPRRSVLADIATELDIPLTTLRYRLRRAEAWALDDVFARTQLRDERSIQTPP